MTKETKPRILLCWGYHRSGFREIFEPLREQFDFHYLWWTYPPAGTRERYLDPVHYWTDFGNSQNLLKRIRPVRVVFLGIDAPHTVVLNLACRRAGIETLWVQHGITTALDDYIRLEEDAPSGNLTFSRVRVAWALLLFSLRSLKWTDTNVIFSLLKWNLEKRFMTAMEAMGRNQARWRLAERYVVFTKENAGRLIHERDGVPYSSMVEIGYPIFDEFASRLQEARLGDYYVLIDQPLFSTPGNDGLYQEEKRTRSNILDKMGDYCARRGRRLIVKLHPESYAAAPLVSHPNLEYVRDIKDLVGLILGARGIFGYNSTLLLAALYLKPCCLYRIGPPISFYRDLEQCAICPILETTENPEDAAWESFVKSPESLAAFRALYLYRADGEARLRLAILLRGQSLQACKT